MFDSKRFTRFILAIISGLLFSGELLACSIDLPQYLCWEYWEEYSAAGVTKTNPDSSYYFPVEGGATVKYTFLLYNPNNHNGAYNHRLDVAPQDQGLVSVTSQSTFMGNGG